MTKPGSGRVGRAGGCPIVCAWIVFAAGIEIIAGTPSAPNDHLVAGQDCRVIVTSSGRIGSADGCPTISARVISAAGVERIASIPTAPDNHLTTGPDCRVIVTRAGRTVMLVAAQLSVPGLYLPPVRSSISFQPPQTIISLPSQTAV